jgi:enoyl-CoA hydratase
VIDRKPPLRWAQLDCGKRNPLGPDAINAMRVLAEPDPEAPVVILRGRPDGFSVGLDNATLAAGEAERESLLAAMGQLLLDLLQSPTRIIAICEGHAVAAGAMLLLVADVRIGCTGEYKVGFTEPGLGMPLPELPALLARERLDRRRLHELTVLGRTVGPEAALDAGFLDQLVDEKDLDNAAETAALSLSRLSDAAYRGSNASVHAPALERIAKLVEEQHRRAEVSSKAASR